MINFCLSARGLPHIVLLLPPDWDVGLLQLVFGVETFFMVKKQHAGWPRDFPAVKGEVPLSPGG